MANDKLSEQSMDFAVSIVNLVKTLKEKRESIISNQIGRSGTSIGANIYEANYNSTNKTKGCGKAHAIHTHVQFRCEDNIQHNIYDSHHKRADNSMHFSVVQTHIENQDLNKGHGKKTHAKATQIFRCKICGCTSGTKQISDGWCCQQT